MMSDIQLTGYHYNDEDGDALSDGGPSITSYNNIACFALPERGHGVRRVT